MKERILGYLTEGGIDYHEGENGELFFIAAIKTGLIRMMLQVDEEKELFWVVGRSGVYLEAEHKAAACMILNDFNASSCHAMAYLGPEDGELMASYACNALGGALNAEITMAALQVVMYALQILHPMMLKHFFFDVMAKELNASALAMGDAEMMSSFAEDRRCGKMEEDGNAQG